jgi:sigma-B regulation protein RsbU (phosphoserine phosphatase)
VRLSRKDLVSILKQQATYICVALIVSAVFWAEGERVNALKVILYTFFFGNVVSAVMTKLQPYYWNRPAPYNWIMYAVCLLGISAPVFAICGVLLWWLEPLNSHSLYEALTGGWKFPLIVMVVYSTVHVIYRSTRDRLEQRNLELERSVERESAQVQMQKQELERAREIQEGLLPKQIPQLAGFEVSAAWRPAREVSGDYFDVFRLGESQVAFCVADVVGKGVSAALLMANVQAAVRAFASEHVSPAELCGKVNRLLCENVAAGKFVTFLFGILDCGSRRLVYCNAGHPDPILITKGAAAALDGSGAVLGVFPSWQYKNEVVELAEGDRFLVFTDGITEAEAPDEVEFGEERIAVFAARHRTESATELSRLLLDRVDAYCQSHFHDDATLVVVAAK